MIPGAASVALPAALMGQVELVQADLAHLELGLLDMRAQEELRLLRLAREDRCQHAGVLLVGGGNALGVSEVQAPHDADPLGDVGMDARELGVADRRHEGRMKRLILPCHFHPVGHALPCRNRPDLAQRGKRSRGFSLA